MDHYLSTGLPLAGFGHHLYPDGDPRAAALLALFEPPEVIARFIEKVTDLTGLQPNIDVALAALVAHHRLPADAAFGLFATARSVGLLAHSMEQLGETQVIRPRGRYVGPMPNVPQDVLSASVSFAGDTIRCIEGPQRVCAVKRRRFPVGARPTRQPLQPEATGAVMEVTKWLKPSGKRATNRWQRECAGRNASERRASLEKDDAQADPTTLSGKADITGRMSEAVPPVAVPG